MKKIDFGKAVATIANLGVIVGIGFLIVELRQNNEQLSAQSRYNYYQNRIAEYWTVAQSPEMVELMTRANAGEALSPMEQNRVTQRMYALITGWEYEFGELERGRLSESDFNPAAKRQVYRSLPALAKAWEQYKIVAPRPFVEFMERNITAP